MFEQTHQSQSAQKIDSSSLNPAGFDLLKDDESITDELREDDLEQISGGATPLSIGLTIATVAGVAFTVGVAKGIMDGEAEERDQHHKGGSCK